MRSLHLTIMIFCHILLASFVIYSHVVSGSPVEPVASVPKQQEHQSPSVGAHKQVSPSHHAPVRGPVGAHPVEVQKAPLVVVQSVPEVHRELPKVDPSPVLRAPEAKQEAKVVRIDRKESPVAVQEPVAKSDKPQSVVDKNQHKLVESKVSKQVVQQASPESVKPVSSERSLEEVEKKPSGLEQVVAAHLLPVPVPVQVPAQRPVVPSEPVLLKKLERPSAEIAKKELTVLKKLDQIVAAHEVSDFSEPPVVNGGLGPLHLLAATLCSYQPERAAADETLTLLYARRASVRKSLFDFMSLKFTNLEKLSSRLNAGLEVVPPKPNDPSQPSVVPSHGWPLVGKCTAHDLKLMAEAAWCECAEEPACASKTSEASRNPPTATKPESSSTEALDKETPKITSNHHQRARSLTGEPQAPANQQSPSVVSKLLHVNDIKDAPVIESSLANLNLTQQQLASIQAQASSTRECRRNSLRLTKALFNHLAEDQKSVSESWPKLYAQLSEDECARKRMVDIVSALSGFRSESTSIRRDNVEFAFAMDDLRAKVLESEVNVPLTFDKEFIEVGQFLQQSVKLMLANIDPERARLTSMRYRSYMPGPVSVDDQCIELHQRLLAKNYPNDCNPTQFGQLPDVLRMAASSLELWSIENELSKYSQKTLAQDSVPPCAVTAKKRAINECIANLVTS